MLSPSKTGGPTEIVKRTLSTISCAILKIIFADIGGVFTTY
jgi:hypothetical protein